MSSSERASVQAWFGLALATLNSLWSGTVAPEFCLSVHGPVTLAQQSALDRLLGCCVSFIELNPGGSSPLDVAKEMKARSAYGETEVGSAHTLSLERVKPTLPPAGVAASIEAADLCQGFTRQALLEPEKVILPEEEVTDKWRPPRMRIAPADLRPLLVLLVTLGIICIVNDVWRLSDGTEVAGGMFGVEKDSQHSNSLRGRRVVLASEAHHELRAAEPLPTDAHRRHPRAPDGIPMELVVTSGRGDLPDVRPRQTLFLLRVRAPEPVAEVHVLQRACAGVVVQEGARGMCWLASAVVPMGWRSAVAVCQECHRAMLRAAARMPRRVASPPEAAGLAWEFELRRDRIYPVNGDPGRTRTWEVYVDNLFEGEIFLREELEERGGHHVLHHGHCGGAVRRVELRGQQC